mgnify:CR=1 FL=1
MSRHQTWWYKTYEVFRYKIPYFLRNLWFFRNELWEFRGWDYSHNLNMFARSLERTSMTLEFHGSEEDKSRMKKVEKIKRVIHLMKNSTEVSSVFRAESELGEIRGLGNWLIDEEEETPEDLEHNRKVYSRADEIQESEWNEIWDILRGQNKNEYKKMVDKLSPEELKKRDVWNEWFDGSGLRGWWD